MAGALVALSLWYLTRNGLRRSRREWIESAGRLFLLGATLSISFLAAELFFRSHLRKSQGFNSIEHLRAVNKGEKIPIRSNHALAMLIQVSQNKNLIFEHQRGVTVEDFGNFRVRLNNAGMRESVEYAREKKPGCIRILGIGDSGMWGWGVQQDQDYLAVLESNLNSRADGNTYEVLNLAVPAYNSAQEVEMLRDRGLIYDPDIVVLGWCDNDTSLPIFLYKHRKYDERDISYILTWLFAREKSAGLFMPSMCEKTEIRDKLLAPELADNRGWPGVRKAFSGLKQLRDEHGFKLLVFGAMTNEVVDICGEMGFDYYNTRAEIPKDRYPAKEYAIHWMHPRPKGHAALAGHLEDTLRKRGWLPDLPPAAQ